MRSPGMDTLSHIQVLPQPLMTSQNVEEDACAGGRCECEIILLLLEPHPLPSKSLLDHSTKGTSILERVQQCGWLA